MYDTITLFGERGTYIFSPEDPQSLLQSEKRQCFIYLGFDLQSQRQVAIKVLFRTLTSDPKNIERARREASIQIQYENLLEMLDFIVDQVNEVYHIISEFVPGITLKQYMKHYSNGLPLDEVLHIAEGISAGLMVLHSHSPAIIHRGIDPSNILLHDMEGIGERYDLGSACNKVVKIMDYGLVKMAIHEATEFTKSDDFSLESVYVAPDVLEQELPFLDPSFDVYSFAVILYEMITVTSPFSARQETELLTEKASFQYQEIEIISLRLNEALKKALSSNPRQRFKSLQEFQWIIREELVHIANNGNKTEPIEIDFDSSDEEFNPIQRFRIWFLNLDQIDDVPNF